MDDSSGDLRRQRELIAAHLRWLDEQIARTLAASPLAPQSPVPPISSPVPGAPTPAASPHPASSAVQAPSAPPDPAAIPELAMPEIDPGSIRNEVRRGCLIYIAIITVLLAASIAVAVWIARLY